MPSKRELQRDIQTVGDQIFREEFAKYTSSVQKMPMALSCAAACFKNRLEREHPDRSFHLYGMIAPEGKLAQHAIKVSVTHPAADIASFVYSPALQPNGFDCLFAVAGAALRTKSVPNAIKGRKKKIEDDVRAAIQTILERRMFCTGPNQEVASDVTQIVIDHIGKEEHVASMVVTIILPSDVEFQDITLRTFTRDTLVVQAQFRNTEFVAVVIVTFLPLD